MITIIGLDTGCDGYYLLFHKQDFITSGDEYHDDIQSWIDGWISGFMHVSKIMFGPQVEIEKRRLNFEYDCSHENDHWENTQYHCGADEKLDDYIERICDLGFYLEKDEA